MPLIEARHPSVRWAGARPCGRGVGGELAIKTFATADWRNWVMLVYQAARWVVDVGRAVVADNLGKFVSFPPLQSDIWSRRAPTPPKVVRVSPFEGQIKLTQLARAAHPANLHGWSG